MIKERHIFPFSPLGIPLKTNLLCAGIHSLADHLPGTKTLLKTMSERRDCPKRLLSLYLSLKTCWRVSCAKDSCHRRAHEDLSFSFLNFFFPIGVNLRGFSNYF